MTQLVVCRIAWSVVVVWFVVTAAFLLIATIPADPVKALLGPHATPEAITRVRAHYCLDEDVVGQYGCYVAGVVRGDLGESYRSKRPVSAIVADRIWPTAQLALAAIILQLLVGVPLGVIAAMRRNHWPDHATNVVGLLGQSAPTFVSVRSLEARRLRDRAPRERGDLEPHDRRDRGDAVVHGAGADPRPGPRRARRHLRVRRAAVRAAHRQEAVPGAEQRPARDLHGAPERSAAAPRGRPPGARVRAAGGRGRARAREGTPTW